MPHYTYEEIARIKQKSYDNGYKEGYGARLKEEYQKRRSKETIA